MYGVVFFPKIYKGLPLVREKRLNNCKSSWRIEKKNFLWSLISLQALFFNSLKKKYTNVCVVMKFKCNRVQ